MLPLEMTITLCLAVSAFGPMIMFVPVLHQRVSSVRNILWEGAKKTKKLSSGALPGKSVYFAQAPFLLLLSPYAIKQGPLFPMGNKSSNAHRRPEMQRKPCCFSFSREKKAHCIFRQPCLCCHFQGKLRRKHQLFVFHRLSSSICTDEWPYYHPGRAIAAAVWEV